MRVAGMSANSIQRPANSVETPSPDAKWTRRTMNIAYSLVGYDRATGFATVILPVPDSLSPRAKRIADMPEDDPDMIGDWPLPDPTARAIADLIHARIDLERTEFCLEPHPPTPETVMPIQAAE